MLVDSHCHLDRVDLSPYQGDLSKALQAAKDLDVRVFLCVCIDMQNYEAVLKIAEQFPEVYASVGLHPDEKAALEPSVEELIEKGRPKKVIAVGETGLDFYRLDVSSLKMRQTPLSPGGRGVQAADAAPRGEGAMAEGPESNIAPLEIQIQRFRNHIRAARELKKPLIVHTRQAREETIQILKEEKAEEVGGVLHCFTENWAMAEQAMALGFYISFSGIVTFKNAVELKEIAQKVPLDRLLVETDAPYLAPVPYRGKPNQPAYVRYVAEAIAALRGESFERIAEASTKNFQALFGVSI